MGAHYEYEIIISTRNNAERLKLEMPFISLIHLNNGISFFPLTKEFNESFFNCFDFDEFPLKYHRPEIDFTECENFFFIVDYSKLDPIIYFKMNIHDFDWNIYGHEASWLFDGKTICCFTTNKTYSVITGVSQINPSIIWFENLPDNIGASINMAINKSGLLKESTYLSFFDEYNLKTILRAEDFLTHSFTKDKMV